MTGERDSRETHLFKLFGRGSKAQSDTASQAAVVEPEVEDAAPGAEAPPSDEAIEVIAAEEAPNVEDSEELAERTDAAVERTRRTWFRRIAGAFERSTISDELWEELEEILIGADAGIDTTDRLLRRTRERVQKEGIKDPAGARDALKAEMVAILDDVDVKGALWDSVQNLERKPAIILVVGVNGAGKTTSIAKLAAAFKRDGEQVLIAAGDTFRAAAIEQIKLWGDRTGVEVIASQPGADPAAIVFDAVAAAQKRQTDVVLVDTAGRLHTKFNLMEELAKIRRTAGKFDPDAPHEVLLVLDATTGQNGLAQAKTFTDAIGVTAIFLAKLDGTAKGGIVFSICDQLHIPVRFIGTGERAADVALFDPAEFVDALFATHQR
jgi:fused signal recognition particle receptor